MRTLIATALLLIFCSGVLAGEESVADVYQARMVVTIEDNTSATNLWGKSGLMRVNMAGGRAFNSAITNYHQKKSWALSSSHMIYQEFPSKSLRSYVPEFFNPELNLKKEFITAETINGIECKKYRAIITQPDRPRVKGFLWEAISLPGYPLQWEEPARQVHASWRNAKLVVKPASFFKIPADYREQKAKPFAAYKR